MQVNLSAVLSEALAVASAPEEQSHIRHMALQVAFSCEQLQQAVAPRITPQQHTSVNSCQCSGSQTAHQLCATGDFCQSIVEHRKKHSTDVIRPSSWPTNPLRPAVIRYYSSTPVGDLTAAVPPAVIRYNRYNSSTPVGDLTAAVQPPDPAVSRSCRPGQLSTKTNWP
jgi:hypothetical protein